MLILAWIFVLFSLVSADNSILETEYEWKFIDFIWTNQAQKTWYIDNDLYIPQNIFPLDVERAKDGRTFVTLLRVKGVPVTLATVSNKYNNESGPLLKPYPNWFWYNKVNPCDNIINAYRFFIDKCDRLWVLDTGDVNQKLCPTKILVFNLKNDQLIFVQTLDDQVSKNNDGMGRLTNIIIENNDLHCHNNTIYIADPVGHGLLVGQIHKIVRMNGNSFTYEKENSNFSIAENNFYLEDGIIGIALSQEKNNRRFFYKPLASKSLYAVNADDLKSASFGTHIDNYVGVDVFPSQAIVMVVSAKGTLFYSLTTDLAIGCWNINQPLESQYFKIVLNDTDRLQFTSGMKLKKRLYNDVIEEYLLMLSNRFQKFMSKTINIHEVNFRILSAPVEQIIKGTACEAD